MIFKQLDKKQNVRIKNGRQTQTHLYINTSALGLAYGSEIESYLYNMLSNERNNTQN